MPKYSVSRSFARKGLISEKSAAVMRMFGVTVERLDEMRITHSCRLDMSPGDIVYITGTSGAGKSVLLRGLQEAVGASDGVNLDEIELPADRTLIDCVEGDFLEGLRILSIAGLSDVDCLLNQPANLSEGQKWRFRLAMALSMGRKFVFADEFCSNLDRITAAVISYRLRRFAKKHAVGFVLASSHRDILTDLEPDVLVIKELSGPTQVIYKDNGRGLDRQESRGDRNCGSSAKRGHA